MGKPGEGHASSLPAEHIGRIEQTEGTETSKYLQEEKAIAISLVAASERERAQTDVMSSVQALWCRGCGVTSDLSALRSESKKSIG